MKILIIGLDGASPEQLLEGDRMAHLRWLMETGCYGKLAEQVASGTAAALAVAEQLVIAEKRVKSVGLPVSSGGNTGGLEGDRLEEIYVQTRRGFQAARDMIRSDEWECLLFVESGLDQIRLVLNNEDESNRSAASTYYEHFDTKLGELLEALDSDTAILILLATAARGSFILAAPNSPLSGEFQGVQVLDLAPTLMELGGYDVPASMQGRSLISRGEVIAAEGTDYTNDAEAAIRERLSGLGYI